jgi:hypothetical protein
MGADDDKTPEEIRQEARRQLAETQAAHQRLERIRQAQKRIQAQRKADGEDTT